MKVLQLSTFDTNGGAARATHRIHTALRKTGVDSTMLVAKKWGVDPSVQFFPVRFHDRKDRYAQKIIALQHTPNPVMHSINLFPSGIHKHINQSDADIVHFHWIHWEMISLAEIAQITKPIVWTLHDMWAFCGAEHYEDLHNPGRYIQGYTRDNRPAGYSGPDINAWAWHRKEKFLKPLGIDFVTPSHWLANCVRESSLFCRHDVTTVGNCLDTDIFFPVDRELARKLHGLPADRKLLLFGADYSLGDPRKGYDLLQETLARLAADGWAEKCEAVVFGVNRPGGAPDLPMKAHFVGRIKHDGLMALLYSAADVFVAPSRQDNLPNTVLEALACGLPCAAFRLGGMGDLVEHRENGFLAEPYDTEDLAGGIEWLLEEGERHDRLRAAARSKVKNSFAQSPVALRYRSLYEEVLAKRGGAAG